MSNTESAIALWRLVRAARCVNRIGAAIATAAVWLSAACGPVAAQEELGPPPQPVYLNNKKVRATWEWAQAAWEEIGRLRARIDELDAGQGATSPGSPGPSQGLGDRELLEWIRRQVDYLVYRTAAADASSSSEPISLPALVAQIAAYKGIVYGPLDPGTYRLDLTDNYGTRRHTVILTVREPGGLVNDPPDWLVARPSETPGKVKLTWQDNSDTEHGFRVYWSHREDMPGVVVAETAEDLTTAEVDLHDSDNWFWVTAWSDTGESAPSNKVFVERPVSGGETQPPAEPPPALESIAINMRNWVAFADQDYSEPRMSGEALGYFHPGDWVDYEFTTSAEGDWVIEVNIGSPNNGAKIALAVDGTEVSVLDVPNTGSWTNFSPLTTDPVHLAAGSHTLRLTGRQASDQLWIGDVRSIRLLPSAP